MKKTRAIDTSALCMITAAEVLERKFTRKEVLDEIKMVCDQKQEKGELSGDSPFAAYVLKCT